MLHIGWFWWLVIQYCMCPYYDSCCIGIIIVSHVWVLQFNKDCWSFGWHLTLIWHTVSSNCVWIYDIDNWLFFNHPISFCCCCCLVSPFCLFLLDIILIVFPNPKKPILTQNTVHLCVEQPKNLFMYCMIMVYYILENTHTHKQKHIQYIQTYI